MFISRAKPALGKVTFNKIYKAEDGLAESAAPAAVQKFQAMLEETYKKARGQDRRAPEEAGAGMPTGTQSMAVAVPFCQPARMERHPLAHPDDAQCASASIFRRCRRMAR